MFMKVATLNSPKQPPLSISISPISLWPMASISIYPMIPHGPLRCGDHYAQCIHDRMGINLW